MFTTPPPERPRFDQAQRDLVLRVREQESSGTEATGGVLNGQFWVGTLP